MSVAVTRTSKPRERPHATSARGTSAAPHAISRTSMRSPGRQVEQKASKRAIVAYPAEVSIHRREVAIDLVDRVLVEGLLVHDLGLVDP